MYCLPDSFQFDAHMRTFQPNLDTDFFVSLDISSLFTNISLDNTIGICADILYRGPINPPEIVFVELMVMATNSVTFSFDNCIY